MTRFRVAILGTSFGRLVQAPAFQRHAGFDLVAIAGSSEEKTRGIAGELGVARGYGDWRRLLAEESLDLVSVATPAYLHHPMMLAALDLVRRGGIGTPRRGEILGRYPIWPTPAARGMTWLSDREHGGGILGALGSHHTDCMRLFFGEPRTALASVRVDQPGRGPTATHPVPGTATADDACTVHYEFDGGATALIDLHAAVPYRWERFEIHGSEASLRWDETGYRLWHLSAGKEPEEVEIAESMRLSPREGEPALIAPFSALLDRLHAALCGTAPMSPNFDDAVAVQSALDAARASSAAGSRVPVEFPTAIESS